MAKLVHNVQKKQHRERSQPVDRKKWGLLEKKKDYKLRALDYHEKQALLKILKQKLSLRNPDEYYHAMVNKKTDTNGILISDRGNELLSNDEVQLLKTQDSNYINLIRTKELKDIDKLRKNLNFHSSGKHKVFVDSEQQKQDFDPLVYFQTSEDLVSKTENRLRLDQLVDTTVEKDYQQVMGNYDKALYDKKKLQKFKLLKSKLERETKFRNLYDKMNLQKELMKKGEKVKTTNKDGAKVFKWKTVRKK